MNIQPTLKTKLLFFDDKAVIDSLDPFYRRSLALIGFTGRREGRRNLKPARQKRLAELTAEQRQQYEHAKAEYRDGKRSKKPRRPSATARPGESPRMQFRPNPLRDGATGILFGINSSLDGVVIGPRPFGDNAAKQIEERHPFMSRALKTITPTIPSLLDRARR